MKILTTCCLTFGSHHTFFFVFSTERLRQKLVEIGEYLQEKKDPQIQLSLSTEDIVVGYIDNPDDHEELNKMELTDDVSGYTWIALDNKPDYKEKHLGTLTLYYDKEQNQVKVFGVSLYDYTADYTSELPLSDFLQML